MATAIAAAVRVLEKCIIVGRATAREGGVGALELGNMGACATNTVFICEATRQAETVMYYQMSSCAFSRCTLTRYPQKKSHSVNNVYLCRGRLATGN